MAYSSNESVLTTPLANRCRRSFLRSASTLAGALGLGTAGNLLLTSSAAAQGDYRALVCIFLYGGNDGMNTIVPADSARHAQYSAVRAGLAIPRAELVALDGQVGLHPALSALSKAWEAKQLAPILNVGPLQQPLTKAQYLAAPPNSVLRPAGLFSHSDQQILWETGTTDSLERTGWGGRASQEMGTVNPVISVGGTARFGTTALTAPLVLPGPGSTFGAYGLQGSDLNWAPNAARKAAIDAMYLPAQDTALAEAYAKIHRDAFAASARLSPLVKMQPGDTGASSAINAGFAGLITGGKVTTGLGQQLYQIAKLIEGRATVQGNRQIFFAQIGGFDTHGDQVITGAPSQGTHARKLKELGDAMAAFSAAMNLLGLGSAVTTFTQSDFGRSFKPNGSTGTDHAWGNHHLVMGGAVKGGKTYGLYPELVQGGINDVSNSATSEGRWIPTTSVDQYAATLLRWWGLTDGQLNAVLPNLANFGAARSVGFV
jgi:uncharacterized protein (DUF1501 family)